MVVKLSELLALPVDERLKLVEALWESVAECPAAVIESTAPADIAPLLRELVQGLERTNRVLASALERMSHVDARLARVRAEARDAALRSCESWPFPLPQ